MREKINLGETPVISAVLTDKEFEEALLCPSDYIFLLNSSILNIKERVEKAKQVNKKIFVHVDMAEGIGKDSAGIKFLAMQNVFGIISTRTHMIKMAKECELSTVQRFFIVDSRSFDTALDTIRTANPDMIELMPGVIPKIIASFTAQTRIPTIAGGLIKTKQDIIEAITAGASAVSTTKKELWYL
jgi:Glycerol-3-phosphate responsive antiterminator (mRNA-binding)